MLFLLCSIYSSIYAGHLTDAQASRIANRKCSAYMCDLPRSKITANDNPEVSAGGMSLTNPHHTQDDARHYKMARL